jgi:hypothetical protein
MDTLSSIKFLSEISKSRNGDCISESSNSNNKRKCKKRRVLKTNEQKEIECNIAIGALKRHQTSINITVDEVNINDFLNDRNIKFHNLVKNYQDTDDEINCIELNNSKLQINNLIIKNDDSRIFIDKYIGSGSYGIVFINNDRNARYAIKFIKHSKNYKNEIDIMKQISIKNSMLKQPIPNFIYTAHYNINCNKIEIEDNIIASTLDKCLSFNYDPESSNGKYSMVIMEHLDGTINDILQDINSTFNEENVELFKSIFSQAILSLYIFHNKFNYNHNDAHLNNFFYKKVVRDDKYFYYKIGDINLYVKNLGYLVVLADYGLASENTDDTIKKKIQDYKHIISNIHSLCSYKYNEYYKDKKSIIDNFIRLTNQTSIIPENINELEFIKQLLINFYNIDETIAKSSLINCKAYES